MLICHPTIRPSGREADRIFYWLSSNLTGDPSFAGSIPFVRAIIRRRSPFLLLVALIPRRPPSAAVPGIVNNRISHGSQPPRARARPQLALSPVRQERKDGLTGERDFRSNKPLRELTDPPVVRSWPPGPRRSKSPSRISTAAATWTICEEGSQRVSE